jgi:formylglycine-generating enzyme required for sulfatase activity
MIRSLWTVAVVAACAAGCARNPAGAPPAKGTVAPTSPPGAGEMILIPAGTFLMGDRTGRPDETPHTVAIGEFYLDTLPVTQQLYEKVMGVNPSKHKGPQNPVERTQWTDAVRFCNRCSEREGLTPCYNLDTWQCDFDADGYRLPTEAEWEYACRAGSTARYSFGDDPAELPRYAWFQPLSRGKPRPVGQKLANRWGLYEMHGNVWQWCNDWYGETSYAESPGDNPRGPATGTLRVLRGGAWDCTAEKLRAAYRHKEFPVYSDACFGADSYGFRRARNAVGGVRGTALASAERPKGASEGGSKGDWGGVRDAPARKPGIRGVEDSAPATPSLTPAPAPAGLAALKGTIVFVSDRSGTMKIWTMHASGTGAKQLTRGTNPDADPRFAPDGQQILYTTLRDGFPEVWLMNRDGSGPRFVTKGSQGSWAPDGKSIVFIRDNQTFVRDLDSGQERRVTPEAWERCGVPAFAPDGRLLAVASRHLGEIGIFLVNLDAGETTQLKADEPCCTPEFSSDGKKLLCQTVQGHIHQVDRDGRNWEQLTFGADVQHDARYSPDGTAIVFCRAPAPEGPWQICVRKLDADPEEFVALTREGSNLLPDWHRIE